MLAIRIAAAAMVMTTTRVVSTNKEFADHKRGAERDERDQMLRRGEDDPHKRRRNLERGGHSRVMMMLVFKTLSRILSSAKTFL
jgi:hypothetical protein